MGKLCRKVPYGPGAEELVNRGRKYLNYVETMPSFFGDPRLDEVYRNTMARRTLILANGSTLKTTRGPINRSEAFVPLPAQAAQFVAGGGYFVAVDVYNLTATAQIGLYVSNIEELWKWSFIPLPAGQALPAPVFYGATKIGKNYAEAQLENYKEIIPNLLAADFDATVEKVTGTWSENISQVRSPEPYPAGRVIAFNNHPWEGELCVGNSYLHPFLGWQFAEAGAYSGPNPVEASAIIALGSTVRTVTYAQESSHSVTINGTEKVVGSHAKRDVKIGEYPYDAGFVGSDGSVWYVMDINPGDNLNAGMLNCAGKATSFDGVEFNMLLGQVDITNNSGAGVPPPIDVPDLSGYPRQNEVQLVFNGATEILESTPQTSAIAKEYTYSIYNSPKFYNFSGEKWYLYAYDARKSVGLSNAVVGFARAESGNATYKFFNTLAYTGDFRPVDIGGGRIGLANYKGIRLMERVPGLVG